MRNRRANGFFLTAAIASAAFAIAAFFSLASARADDAPKDAGRLLNSGQILQQVMDAPNSIPEKFLNKARCVIVFPSVTNDASADGSAERHGTMACRIGENPQMPWGAPTMMAMEGSASSLAFRRQTLDYVLLVMNARCANSILIRKVKIGMDASASPGPVDGHDTEDANARKHAEVLTYSHVRGLLEGISLTGYTLRPDNRANERVYLTKMSPRKIALGNEVSTPPSAQLLIETLSRHSPMIGIASWYGKDHQGRLMANGQRFDRRELTAASWNFPLGTIIRVVNVRNGDSVVVKITDRGPSHSLHRIIDLSEAAAERLDYQEQGLTRVSLYPVSCGQPAPEEAERALPGGKTDFGCSSPANSDSHGSPDMNSSARNVYRSSTISD